MEGGRISQFRSVHISLGDSAGSFPVGELFRVVRIVCSFVFVFIDELRDMMVRMRREEKRRDEMR
jgi:hypothetical protein